MTTDDAVGSRLWPFAGVIVALHVVGWGALFFVVEPSHPGLFGTGVLAYVLGLRHAFDADHIAAIDNTTRKFRDEGHEAVGTGFFFALGHSTVVGGVALALAVAASTVESVIPAIRDAGATVAMTVSGGFLYLMGAANLLALIGLLRVVFGNRESHQDPDDHRAHGFFSHIVSGWFDAVHRSWHLYPIGLVFGLGFDTVSEIALLSTATTAAGNGLPVWVVMVLPVLFCAGMALVDTADGVFMARAYDWAFATPARKTYYNLTVTSLSVVLALGVGSIELLHVLASTLEPDGWFWNAVRGLDLGSLGYLVVFLFVVTWGGFFVLWKVVGATRGFEVPANE